MDYIIEGTAEKKRPLFIAITETITSIFLFSMFLVVMLGITARYLLDAPMFWTDELSRFLMFYVVMLGGALAIRENSHPALTFVIDRLPKKAKEIWDIFLFALIIFTLVVVVIYGIEHVQDSIIKKSAALRLSYSIVYLGFPLGGVLMIVEALVKIVGKVKNFRIEKESK